MLVNEGVVARLRRRVRQFGEPRTRILVEREPLRALDTSRSIRTVQRAFALAAVERDQLACGARAVDHAIGVDVAAADADGLLGQRIELAELGLWIVAQEARGAAERA